LPGLCSLAGYSQSWLALPELGLEGAHVSPGTVRLRVSDNHGLIFAMEPFPVPAAFAAERPVLWEAGLDQPVDIGPLTYFGVSALG
jgi:hypothetical protein